MLPHEVTHCRSCKSKALIAIFNLGILASCGVFPRSNEPDAPAAPLALVQCSDCGLVQLAHDYDGEDLYRGSYGYRSGINESMVRHLQSITRMISARVQFEPGDVVLDIGSNDGTLLHSYPAGDTLQRIGIDPTSARFIEHYGPTIKAVPEFFTHANFQRALPGQRARVITSISMFYDLPDPNAFVNDIAQTLRQDGVWVLEQSYLPAMLATNSFDTICHEHLEYYCLHQIDDLCRRNGLKIVDVDFNGVNGGSFQVVAAHLDSGIPVDTAAIERAMHEEVAGKFHTPDPFRAFGDRVATLRARVVDFLKEQKAAGRLVHGYGASTKGNTLLQYFGIGSDLLSVIADRNSDKDGSRTPGTNIPIVSESKSRMLKPDFYFVLPWHFREAFIARERDFLDRGGRFVFPLPQLEIVGGD